MNTFLSIWFSTHFSSSHLRPWLLSTVLSFTCLSTTHSYISAVTTPYLPYNLNNSSKKSPLKVREPIEAQCRQTYCSFLVHDSATSSWAIPIQYSGVASPPAAMFVSLVSISPPNLASTSTCLCQPRRVRRHWILPQWYIVHALVTSRTDYCSIIFANSPKSVTFKIRQVLNAVSRVVGGTKKVDRGVSQLLQDKLNLFDVRT